MTTMNKQSSKRLTFLKVILVGALIVALACVCLFGFSQTRVMAQVSAQDDQKELLKEKETKKQVTTPTTKVVDLVSLIGLDENSALGATGHGALLESSYEISQNKAVKRDVVVLTDESGDKYVGTPTVMLDTDKKGQVVSASYSTGTQALGYGDFSFDEVVSEMYLIENTLHAAGLESVELGTAKLPSKESYTQYATDGKTVEMESWTFVGVTSEGKNVYDWNVTLTYDYSEANSTGNLVYTIKTITVQIAIR
ncbi:MAG: hypothetical protein ACI4BI_02895 [Anaerotardibacter sp.]